MKWNLQKIQSLKKQGKIRGYVVSDKRPKEKPLPLRWLDEKLSGWCGLLGYELKTEYRFHPERKWRFDYYIPDIKTAIEYEGGIFMKKSGHNTATGIMRDIEKYEAAQDMGIKVIRLTVLNYKTVFEKLKQ